MGVVQIVFSPTGGTQKVAEIITERWGQPVKTVDLSSAEYDFSGVHLQKVNCLCLFHQMVNRTEQIDTQHTCSRCQNRGRCHKGGNRD